jgi:DNA polymerase-3 subunit epsilon
MKLKLTRPICFFDLESTGTQITKDRIVQIGIIKIHPNGEEESYNKLVNPTIPIPLEIAEIHGITNERVKNQPTFQELANEIQNNRDDIQYNRQKIAIIETKMEKR